MTIISSSIYIKRIIKKIAQAPDEVTSALYGEKLVHMHKQFLQVYQNHAIECVCGLKFRVDEMYRCLYCGEWFCTECAEAHFGKTRAEYDNDR